MNRQAALIEKFIQGATGGKASNMYIDGDILYNEGSGRPVVLAKRMSDGTRWEYKDGKFGQYVYKRFILNHELSMDYWLAKDHLDIVYRVMSGYVGTGYCKVPLCDFNLMNEFTLHQISVYTHKMMTAVSKNIEYTRQVIDLESNWHDCCKDFYQELRDHGQGLISSRINRAQRDIIRSYMKGNEELTKAKRVASRYKRQAKASEKEVIQLKRELGMRIKDRKMHSIVKSVNRMKS